MTKQANHYSFTFDYNTDDDDVEYVQDILYNAGSDAIAEANDVPEEIIVTAPNAKDLSIARTAIVYAGFAIHR
jgi:5,10-methenyltetrahydromethanopterin hydrogenase